MQESNKNSESNFRDFVLKKVEDCLKIGLENDAIKWCRIGFNFSKDLRIKREFENIMFAIL